MLELKTPLRDYAWGSRTAMAELFGREPSGKPEAELWIGAHPGAPAVLAADGRRLDEAIADDPPAWLGEAVAQRFGRLPFLLKVLSAAEPLSLQVHPTLEQAAAGFAAEELSGPPLDSPERNYKDNQHKPEMIVALTPFEALAGFREPGACAPAFSWLAEAVREQGASQAAQTLAEALSAGDLGPAVALLLRDSADLSRLSVLAARAVDASPDAANAVDPQLLLLPRLAAFHPSDTGVLLALLLNYVTLTPGEAISLPAGVMHAYLEGTGIEIMAASDNVLRGGLTTKHIDVDELLRIVRLEPSQPTDVVPVNDAPGSELYTPGFEEFGLQRLAPGAAEVTVRQDGPAAVVVTRGTLRLRAASGASLELTPGRSAYLAPADAPVVASGDAVAFVGTVGGA